MGFRKRQILYCSIKADNNAIDKNMILPKEKYQKTVKRPYPPLLGSLVLSGITNEKVYKGFFSKPYARKDSLLCDGVWYNNGEAEDFGRYLIATEYTNSKAIKKFSEKLRLRERRLLNSVKKPFGKFAKAFENYMPALTLAFLAEQPFYDKLKSALLHKVSKEKSKMILEILNVPLENNFSRREELDLVANKNIESHVKRYKWFISRNGADVEYTIEQAKEKLNGIDKKKFIEDYRKNITEIIDTIILAKKILGKKFSYLVDAVQFIVFYRTQRTDIISKAIYLHIPTLKKMAKAFKISYEDILFCLESELLSGKIPNRLELEGRKRGYAIASIDNEIKCFTGKEFEELRDKLEDKVGNLSELKGSSASSGKVIGTVRVVNNYNKSVNFQEGEILVTSMTTPEMVPIMKLATAFVTDEGGITCHAAIVAREMKKPCVIGTKLATKVLKDGDFVEVDADNGIVKIISKR